MNRAVRVVELLGALCQVPSEPKVAVSEAVCPCVRAVRSGASWHRTAFISFRGVCVASRKAQLAGSQVVPCAWTGGEGQTPGAQGVGRCWLGTAPRRETVSAGLGYLLVEWVDSLLAEGVVSSLAEWVVSFLSERFVWSVAEWVASSLAEWVALFLAEWFGLFVAEWVDSFLAECVDSSLAEWVF